MAVPVRADAARRRQWRGRADRGRGRPPHPEQHRPRGSDHEECRCVRDVERRSLVHQACSHRAAAGGRGRQASGADGSVHRQGLRGGRVARRPGFRYRPARLPRCCGAVPPTPTHRTRSRCPRRRRGRSASMSVEPSTSRRRAPRSGSASTRTDRPTPRSAGRPSRRSTETVSICRSSQGPHRSTCASSASRAVSSRSGRRRTSCSSRS